MGEPGMSFSNHYIRLHRLVVSTVAILLVVLIAFYPLRAMAAEQQRNVLVLFSNEFELPANQLIARGFQDEIKKSGGFRTFTEFLDLSLRYVNGTSSPL